MEYTELFDGIDELLESGELIVSDGRLYSAVDELDEGIIGNLVQKVQAHNDRKAQTTLAKNALGQKVNEKKLAKAQSHVDKLAFSGKDKSVERATGIVKAVNKTNDNVAKLTKEQDRMNNNAAAIKTSIDNVKHNAKNANPYAADKKYKNTKGKGLGVEANDPAASANYQNERKNPKEVVAESVLVFNMPETLMLSESDNYEYFLEQVLAYNGFKVTENNVNVLHAALENGHAVIE